MAPCLTLWDRGPDTWSLPKSCQPLFRDPLAAACPDEQAVGIARTAARVPANGQRGANGSELSRRFAEHRGAGIPVATNSGDD